MKPGTHSNPFFQSNLVLTLKLESDGKEIELPTGNIEKILLDLHSYGFTSSIQFCAFDKDELDEMFKSPKILKATITFKPTDPEGGSAPLLEIKGIVTDRSFKRLPAVQGKEDKAYRLYEIYFCDHAKAVWEQHHPTNIYVDESMKDVIEKHINPDITIKYDWNPIETKYPITAFSLPHQPWLRPREQTNFYSFLIWYLHQENGLLLYHHDKHTYTITGKKNEPSGDPLEIPEWLAMPPLCIIPQTPRYNSRTLTHSADNMTEEDKENQDSYKSVRRELFDAANYRIYPEHANEKIQSTLDSQQNEIEFELTSFTKKILINKLIPGSFVCFKGDKEGNWTRQAEFKDKKFRIRSLYFEANKLGISEEIDKKSQAFGLYIKAKLEDEKDTFVEWPRFTPPTYPFHVHGKIFCDIGDKEQSTYKIQESDNAPQGEYLVLIPLEGQQKKVVAPFVPAYSGQYYYPFCKDARVMMSMHFRTARVERPIEWDPLARLPSGVQGNQAVLASNGKDKYTIIRHEYENGKNSVYTIKQSSSDQQTQTVQIKEKEIVVSVDTKDKKTLFLRLNNDSGYVLSLEDKDAGMTQQIAFDGKSMTHTCKGSAGTSTIIQKPDSINIECKEFTIKSDTITFDAKDTISHAGKNAVNIESKVANVNAPSVKLGG